METTFRFNIVQANLKSEEGVNLRPDVIINLPDKKHFVIDSKVSLTAYERLYSIENPTEREIAMRQHVQSLRTHIQQLAQKKYQDQYAITAPDFIFMFIPIEPALGLALQKDATIFNDAFEKRIILVTPSTLLATLLTIAQIWKQEKQTRNALEIARKSGALYDKFEGLYQDLLEVSKNISKAASANQNVLDKLKNGRGNLIKSVEELKRLGAKTQKSLPSNLLDAATESDSQETESEQIET
jgi:DNA recombination protein RmuC